MTRALKASAAAAAIAILCSSANALAQGGCLPVPEFERQAHGQYKESPIHYGTASNGWTMTVWVSEGGGDMDARRHLARWENGLPAGGRHQLDRRQLAQGQG